MTLLEEYHQWLSENKKKKKSRCWTGYKPVKGKAPYSPGSCEPIDESAKMVCKDCGCEKGNPKKGCDCKHDCNDHEGSHWVMKEEYLEEMRKEHKSNKGGLTAAGRAYFKRTEGANLKPPVTEKDPTGKQKARKKSFCARMSGVKGPTSVGGELTRKGLALKRWRCS